MGEAQERRDRRGCQSVSVSRGEGADENENENLNLMRSLGGRRMPAPYLPASPCAAERTCASCQTVILNRDSAVR